MTDDELKQLVASNSRAIQALSDNIAELTNDVRLFSQESRETQAQMREAILGIANLLTSLDEDRPTILRKLNSIENKIDQIIEQGEE